MFLLRLFNDTILTSVFAIHLDEQGEVAKAVAMLMVYVYVSAAVQLTHSVITKKILHKTQAWRYNIIDGS